MSRLCRREPAFVAAAAAILALGIGASVATFAVAHAVILRPLPFADQDRLVMIWERDPARDRSVWEVSYRDFLDWKMQAASFSDLAAMGSVNWSVRLVQAEGPMVLPLAAVSGTFFEVLGTTPALGAAFATSDDRRGAQGVAVLSHRTWQTHFHGDPGIVGRAIVLDPGDGARAFTVSGVMPEDFDFPRGAAVWLPLAPVLGGASTQIGFDTLESRGLGVLYVVGRLRAGATLSAASGEMDVIVRQLTSGVASKGGRRAVLTPLTDYILGRARPTLLLLMAAGGLVLALTCANVAGLLMTRLTGRRRITAICLALGAERRHLVQQSCAEAAVIAVCGVAGALLLAAWSLPILIALVPDDVPRLAEAGSFRPEVLVFTAGLGSLCALVCGVMPLAMFMRRRPINLLRVGDQGSRPGVTGRSAIVVLQVALSVMLLVGAGLTARSFRAIQHVDLGFDPARVLTLDVLPPPDSFSQSEVNARFYARVIDRIRALPGVAGVAAVYLRPFEHGPIGSDVAVIIEGQPPDDRGSWQRFPTLNSEAVSTDYFGVMGIPLVRGRLFTDADRPGAAPVAIVSKSAAHRLWPGQDAIGRKLMASGDQPPNQWQTVVGIVGDVRYRGVSDPRLDLYRPYLQSEAGVKHLMIKVEGDPAPLQRTLRSEVRAVHRGAVVEAVRSMDDVVGREYAPWRFTAVLFSVMAGLAVTLASMGLYATLSAQVAGRMREIGIRIALGAGRLRVVVLVVRWVVLLVGGGLGIGLAAAAVASRGLRGLLFAVSPTDVGTYASVCVLLIVISLCAALRPAHRAARVDPLVVLKEE